MNTILVIAPHPDDETLGCGGTLLKHRARGDDIHWAIITGISEEEGWAKSRVDARRQEIRSVAQAYGFTSVSQLDFPAKKLDRVSMSDLVGAISAVVAEVRPHTVYLNTATDIHTDHQLAFKAGISSLKTFRHPYTKRVLMYETLSETDFAAPFAAEPFQANVFVDVSNYFDEKCQIMNIYSSEVMAPPLPRSMETIKALGMLRGSRIGATYAEAFTLLNEVS